LLSTAAASTTALENAELFQQMQFALEGLKHANAIRQMLPIRAILTDSHKIDA